MGSPHGRFSSFSKSAAFHDAAGFSHGSFYTDRQNRRTNLPPSLNSAAFGQNTRQNLGEMTPGTGLDMNFTPLLPSQLLLGSPFQPGSPSSFASPQFTSIPTFQQSQHHASNHQPQQPSASQQMYQPVGSPNFGAHFPAGSQSPPYNLNQGFGAVPQNVPSVMHGTSRTVYLGNVPADTSAEEILGHVRSGQIESVRLLPDKNCAFVSFLDSNSATHFHSDAILKKLAIRGQDTKVGWGKPSQVPTSVALAVQQSSASRNVYLGNLPDSVTESELREDLGKFGPIDTVKVVREKNIGFVHFLSIGNAIKAVSQLPHEPKWQPPRRVYYGKDRCAYVSKTQQQNAAQYLGIAPGYAHVLNGADRDLISNALAQQSVAAAAVATAAGGITNMGNRTVYLGNIHPETTIEEICNVVRGGLLHHVRYIPDKHICFVTFIDATSAASFYALSNLQGLMIHNRRLKIGWGKHSGALPPAIALAVSGGASRNVYIGNLDESWSEERLRQDFSEYGEIELVNALREKSCAFVNFTNIANAIKAIEAMRGTEEYKNFKINFGKDRCGNAPRQANLNQQQPASVGNGPDSLSQSPVNGNLPNGSASPSRSGLSPAPGSTASLSQVASHGQMGPTPSAILNAGNSNPLTMYLNQVSQQQPPQPDLDSRQNDPFAMAALQQQQSSALAAQQVALYNHSGNDLINGSIEPRSPSAGGLGNQSTSDYPSASNGGSLMVPSLARTQHSRAISLPVFSQEPLVNGTTQTSARMTNSRMHHRRDQSTLQPPSHHYQQNSLSGIGTGFRGFGNSSFGLAISAGSESGRSLNGWGGERS